MPAPRSTAASRTQGPDDPAGQSGGDGGRRRSGLVFAAIVVVAMLGMWAWIFGYHISGSWRSETPGRMDDPGYGEAAEVLCQDAERRTAALPEAFEADTAAERADALDLVDAELTALVDGLAALEVTTEADRAMVDEWVADWRQYLDDRRDYADRLRQDPDARFYVTQSDRDEVQITEAIDRFAAVNQMPSCITPSDLA